MKMKNDYLKHEREIIDYCQQKLNQYITREYYENGESYRPTKLDKQLDKDLNQMMKNGSATKYMIIKTVIDILKKMDFEIKCPEYPKSSIIIWLFVQK